MPIAVHIKSLLMNIYLHIAGPSTQDILTPAWPNFPVAEILDFLLRNTTWLDSI